MLIDNLWRVGTLLSMVVISNHLVAQPPESNLRPEPTSSVIDSLSTPKKPVVQARSNRLKINPFSLLAGQLSLFYERALTPQTAIVVGYGRGGNTDNFGRQLQPGGAIYQRLTLNRSLATPKLPATHSIL